MANYNLTQTGAEIQVILDRVATGYIYMGTADLTTTPDTTNPNVYYFLTAVGTYTNFGNIRHTSGIGIAIWNGMAWSHQNVPSSAVEDVYTTNNTNSDFEIADQSGNAIVRFTNGGIRTKNFNSEDIQLETELQKKLKGKKIGIIGDSISTFNGWVASDVSGYDGTTYAVYYPHGTLTSVQSIWWYKVCEAVGLDPSADVINCSWSGSRVTGDSTSTTTAYAACSDRRISDLSLKGFTPDIIICFISCNDWGNNIAVGTWQITDAIPSEGTKSTMREAYALMLAKLHTAYPLARIFCCTNLDDLYRDAAAGWPSNNTNGVSTQQWNDNIKEIASAFGCDVIDIHNCGINYHNIETYYAVDSGLHPNDVGHTLMANKVLNDLNAKY